MDSSPPTPGGVNGYKRLGIQKNRLGLAGMYGNGGESKSGSSWPSWRKARASTSAFSENGPTARESPKMRTDLSHDALASVFPVSEKASELVWPL